MLAELDHQLRRYEELLVASKDSKEKLKELEAWQSRSEREKLQRAGDEESRISQARKERDEARRERLEAERRREAAERDRDQADGKRREAETQKRQLEQQLEQLQEEKREAEKKRREVEREVKEANRVNSELQSAVSKLQVNEQGKAARSKLEKELLSTNKELLHMEGMLREARQEFDQIKCRQDEMRSRTNSTSSVGSKDSRINVLKSKFQASTVVYSYGHSVHIV